MKTADTPTRIDDTIASYSSKGPTAYDYVVKPDIVAPGNQIISALAPNAPLLSTPTDVYLSEYSTSTTTNTTSGGNTKNNKISPSYMRLSGTSMATPVVSGAAALLIQQHPSLTPDQVKARLMKTAVKAVNLYSTGIDANTLQSFNSQSDIFTVWAGYYNIAASLSYNDLTH